jgi:glycosyltransferase involved in cell wall biosynthesis
MGSPSKVYSKYSIIVPSYNRQEEIEELLESFLALEFPPERLELIIADDGSVDKTKSVVKEYQRKLSFEVRFYSQKNQGPGTARNMGAKKAKGDFFIFIDSDCMVPSDWLKNIDAGLMRQNADAFGGRDSFHEDFPVLLKAINYSMTSFLTTGGLRGSRGKKLAKFYPRSFNMGLSKQTFHKIGGFGSLRHGQDIEFSHRLIKSGAKIVYIDNAIVFHKRRTSIKKFFKQVFNWGVARINLYKIDQTMLEPLHVIPAVVTLFFLFLLFSSILTSNVWHIAKWLFLIGIIVILFSTLQAMIRYKSWHMIYLIPIIIPIQIFGYGLGFISAFFYRVVLNREELVGFKRKYYK